MHNYAYCGDIMLKYVPYVLGPRSANCEPFTNVPPIRPKQAHCETLRCQNYSLFRPQYGPYLSIIYN